MGALAAASSNSVSADGGWRIDEIANDQQFLRQHERQLRSRAVQIAKQPERPRLFVRVDVDAAPLRELRTNGLGQLVPPRRNGRRVVGAPARNTRRRERLWIAEAIAASFSQGRTRYPGIPNSVSVSRTKEGITPRSSAMARGGWIWFAFLNSSSMAPRRRRPRALWAPCPLGSKRPRSFCVAALDHIGGSTRPRDRVGIDRRGVPRAACAPGIQARSESASIASQS